MSDYQVCGKCDRVSKKRNGQVKVKHYEDDKETGESRVDTNCPFNDCLSGSAHLTDWDNYRGEDDLLPIIPSGRVTC